MRSINYLRSTGSSQGSGFVCLFLGPENIGCVEPSFFEERLELRLGERFVIVIDRGEGVVARFDQLDDLPACGAGRLLINHNVSHRISFLLGSAASA